ncbi:MAG: hypothetical protein IJ512_03940 [Ruminococcus sp.]|nr:hypothetical protein [Ruminococcus sp.]
MQNTASIYRKHFFTRTLTAIMMAAAMLVPMTGCNSDPESGSQASSASNSVVLQAETVAIPLAQLQENDYKVSVPITITGHSGFTAVNFGILFDERIAPLNGKKSGILTDIEVLSADALNEDLHFYWTSLLSNPDTITGETPVCQQEGEFWNVTFQLPEDAAAGDVFAVEIPVDGIGRESASVVQGESVTPVCMNGEIQVTE